MKESILDRFRRWNTRDHYRDDDGEPWWVIWLVAIVCGIIGLVLLTGCASAPPCDPIVIEKPGPVIKVPVPVPPQPLALSDAPASPDCMGTSAEIVKCVADYIQALRDYCAELRDEILSHNAAATG